MSDEQRIVEVHILSGDIVIVFQDDVVGILTPRQARRAAAAADTLTKPQVEDEDEEPFNGEC